MTKVIGLIGGSGLGKSTTAAGLYYELKLRGLSVELVREYVKSWAWEGKKVGPYDQAYLFGKQTRYESLLYGKVDYIITDSPVVLSPIYEQFYTGQSVVDQAALKYLSNAAEKGVKHYHVILERNKPFDTRGRYETEDQARAVDAFVPKWLTDNNVSYVKSVASDRERVQEIIDMLEIK